MRVGPQVVVGSVVGAIAGIMALAQWKSKAQALEDEVVGLRGRNRGLESERNSLKSSNDALTANNRRLQAEVEKLKAKDASSQKEKKDA